MGLGGVEGPPKKKLKQAQLNFCASTEKVSNKRKLSDSSDGLAQKLFRKDSGAPKTLLFNKENVSVHGIGKRADGATQKASEPEDVVVLDEESDGDVEKPVCKMSDGPVSVKDAGDEPCQDSKKEVEGTEPTGVEPVGVETTQHVAPVKEGRDTLPSTEAEVEVVDDVGVSPVKSMSPDVKAEDNEGAQQGDCVSKTDDTKSKKTYESEAKDVKESDRAEAKLDKSVDSEQGDMNSSVIVSSEDELDTSTSTTPNTKKLTTPKSASKKAEREKLKEEKRRLKMEKEEKKRKEKEEKEKKKQEEMRLKEEEKKRKEEERKRKEEAKEEEKKRKEDERRRKEEAKEEERRKKEEEKKKKEEIKEEDRRKKEEARLAEERKENLAKAAFTKFFIQEKSKTTALKKDEMETQAEKTERSKFMPFPVKSDMRLAALVRRSLGAEEKNILSDALISSQPAEKLYLQELKNGMTPRSSPATWPLSDEQHDVIIVESVEDDKADGEQVAKPTEKCKGQRAKLLQFHENRRPPYWGTWRKPSKSVGPRRPFGQDKILDYEVDSDSEWEDEEEGEDVDKEDGDSDKEEADDENVGENGYLLDNTFVPHGYLSDEEAAEGEDDDSVEDQKVKLTVLKQEFDQELKSKTQRLQPRLLGCVYISNKTLEVSKSLYEPLMKLRCKWDPSEEPIDVLSPPVVDCSPSPCVSNAKFPSSMVEQLAKLIHGNRSSMKALISEFLNTCDKENQLSAISKRAVFLKVKEIATKTYSSDSGRLVWAVNPELCAELGLQPIVDAPKTVPVTPTVLEPPKPKESPLVNFLKKTTPQGPIKRVSTVLIPRNGPTETPNGSLCGTRHVDTPRPKMPHGGIGSKMAGIPDKPIRRVSTTLISSVAGPVKSKTFNVGEIEKPISSPLATKLPEISSVAGCVSVVDLTDSNDGISPPAAKDTGIPVSAASVTVNPANDATDSSVPLSVEANDASKPSPVDMVSSPASSKSANETIQSATADHGVKPEIAPTVETPSVSAIDQLKPTPMEVDDSTTTAETKPPQTKATPGPPSTPNQVRKRVPFITLSKNVKKTTPSKSPGQKGSIADMLARKFTKKDCPSKEKVSLEPSAVVDLCSDPTE